MTEVSTNEPQVTVAANNMSATVPTDALVTAPAGEELLAGKFKSQDDLVKAYKELETKLGQQPQQPAEEPAKEPEGEPEAKAEEGKEAEGGEEIDPSVYEPYGETIANILKEAKVDPTKGAEEFERDGKLSEETLAAYEKAGLPRAMVEAYTRGLTQMVAADTTITEAQIDQIKAVAGGDEGYSKLASWITTNMTQAEVAEYDAAVTGGDFGKALDAVTKATNRYRADVGTEGKLLGGKTPAAAAGYGSEAEMLKDMANPEYKTNEAFRNEVARKIAASPSLMVTR